MDYGGSWTIVENLLLAATAEGLGSVVHVPVKKEPEQIRACLDIPDGWELPALVILGHAAPDALIPRQVKATLESHVSWDKW